MPSQPAEAGRPTTAEGPELDPVRADGEARRPATTEGAEARVRDALDSVQEMDGLRRAIVCRLRSAYQGRPRHEVAERVEEVFAETVAAAIEGAARLREGEPALLWMIGIAKNVACSTARAEAKEASRRVTAADSAVLERIVTAKSEERTASERMDVETMLARMEPGARMAIEGRFFRDLDGDELARAIGASSRGAARTRLCRAIQGLRIRFNSGVDR